MAAAAQLEDSNRAQAFQGFDLEIIWGGEINETKWWQGTNIFVQLAACNSLSPHLPRGYCHRKTQSYIVV